VFSTWVTTLDSVRYAKIKDIATISFSTERIGKIPFAEAFAIEIGFVAFFSNQTGGPL
jgi:hypothetical protein